MILYQDSVALIWDFKQLQFYWYVLVSEDIGAMLASQLLLNSILSKMKNMIFFLYQPAMQSFFLKYFVIYEQLLYAGKKICLENMVEIFLDPYSSSDWNLIKEFLHLRGKKKRERKK